MAVMTSYASSKMAVSVANLLPVSRLVTCHIKKIKSYVHTGYKLSTKHFKARLRYYYFRFLKTNGCHIEIIHTVSIVTSPSYCNFASAYQILSELDHLRQSYDVISIFQDGGHSVANLLPVFNLMSE